MRLNDEFDSNDEHAQVFGALNITGDLVLENGTNTGTFRFRVITNSGNPAVLNVDGNIDMTSAITSNRIELELRNDAKVEIAGSFVRNAAPNDFGILDCQSTSTIEFNGSTPQQLAQSTGGGSDFFYVQECDH